MNVTNCVNDTQDFFKVNVLTDTLRECFSNAQFAETMEQNINYEKTETFQKCRTIVFKFMNQTTVNRLAQIAIIRFK